MKTPLVFSEPQQFIQWRREQSGSVGFVPTMGALHAGHASLLERARKENDLVVLSIFVNPTQFNDPKDLEKYPRTWDADLKLAQAQGVDAILFPTFENMYPRGYKYSVTESDLSLQFCGAHRPGHFNGVLTIVMKLLQIVNPHKAYFGEKDYQQLSLISGMAQDFFLPVEIIPVPTLREASGLAMSSRNTRLTSEQQIKAASIYQIISKAKTALEAKTQLEQEGFKVDYVEDYESRRLAAVFLGEVRLIDNVKI